MCYVILVLMTICTVGTSVSYSRCFNGALIANYKVCDGTFDCTDLTDECPCEGTNLTSVCDVFYSQGRNLTENNKKLSHVCNGVDDWPNGADEHFCIREMTVLINCSDRIQVDSSKICDHIKDCVDFSDEKGCSNGTHFYCDSTHNGLFIPTKYINNKVYDCRDSSDECEESLFSSKLNMLKNENLAVVVYLIGTAVSLLNIYSIFINSRKIYKVDSRKSLAYYNTFVLINLAFSDLLFGICLLILGSYNSLYSRMYCKVELLWRSGDICQLIGVLTTMSSLTSVNLMLLLTLFRYKVTKHPFTANNSKLRYLYPPCFAIWSFSVIISLAPYFLENYFVNEVIIEPNSYFDDHLISQADARRYIETTQQMLQMSNLTDYTLVEPPYYWSYFKSWYFGDDEVQDMFPGRQVRVIHKFNFYSSTSVCFPDFYSQTSPEKEFSLFITCVSLFSFIVICYCYYKILFMTNRSSISSNASVKNKSNKMLKIITYIIFSNAACWFPIIIMTFISFFGVNVREYLAPISAIVILPINSLINPILHSRLDRVMKRNIMFFYKRFKSI